MIAFIIPDVPRKLKQQSCQEKVIINGLLLEMELRKSRNEDTELDAQDVEMILRQQLHPKNALQLMISVVDGQNVGTAADPPGPEGFGVTEV